MDMLAPENALCCRVHLSFLGFPIANDAQYGGTYKGPEQVRTHASAVKNNKQSDLPTGSVQQNTASTAPTNNGVDEHKASRTPAITNKRQKTDAELPAVEDNGTHQSRNFDAADKQSLTVTDQPIGRHRPTAMTGDTNSKDAEYMVPAELQDSMCLNCPNLIPPGYPIDIHPLWLHAQTYTCDHWSFVCTKPAWAEAKWTP